jgi:uncharacterized membrane protein
MNWRSDISAADRFFACLPYLIPIIDVFRYGLKLMGTLPIFGSVYKVILPIMQIYYGLPMGSLAIFLLLFFLVIRNPNVHRFVRFNTLQAIMLGIVITLGGLALSYLIVPVAGADSLLVEVLEKVMFLGVWAICLFAMIKSALGEYADVPQLSENVHFYIDRM